MAKLKIGTLVQMKKSNAKWHLENPEIYERGDGSMSNSYEQDTLIHLACCLGEPVKGVVTGYGSMENMYFVKFKVGNFKTEYVVEKSHVTKL